MIRRFIGVTPVAVWLVFSAAVVLAGQRILALPIPKPDHVVIGDLFGDGRPILVASFEAWNRTAGRYINGIVYALEIQEKSPVIRWKSPASDDLAIDREFNNLAVGDTDADGRPELFLAREDAVTRFVWTGSGFSEEPVFQLGKKDEPPRRISAIAVGDLDGNRRPEVIVASEDRRPTPHTLVSGFEWQDGRMVQRWETRPIKGRIQSMVTLLSVAGGYDVVWFHTDSELGRLFAIDFSKGREPFGIPLPDPPSVVGMAALAPDRLAVLPADRQRVLILSQKKGAWRVDQEINPPKRPFPMGRLAAFDLDRDGRSDLIAVRGSELVIWEGRSAFGSAPSANQ